MNTPPGTTTAALIVAGGMGIRARAAGPAKQYCLVGGRPVLSYSLDTFLDHPGIDTVQVVIGNGHAAQYEQVAPHNDKLRNPVKGAATRQGSVLAGLEALSSDRPDRVLIHDGARPFIGTDLISRVVEALADAEAVVPTMPVTSTLKSVRRDQTVDRTISREGLHTAETPQGFRFDTIFTAHKKAAEEEVEFTDDAAIAEWIGVRVQAVAGDSRNIKLTTADDIAKADSRLENEAFLRLGDVRVGTGYDVHRFGPGNSVTLGGISIPHNQALVGHSDADVALHALTDAILGALSDGDIGAHFPPTDPQWKGVSSDRFLVDAVRRLVARGGAISHLDLTLIAETPKIGPHRDTMRRRIAEICDIETERVAVKATTHEGLGSIGRGEGISCQAIATIRLPFRGKL